MSAGNQFDRARLMYEMAHDDALEPVETDAECELLGAAHSAAMKRLLLAPAPDLESVALKLEIFAAEDLFDLCEDQRDPLFADIIADVRRLGRHEGRQ